jgi:benzoyl-CoA reductase subunit D
MREALEGQKRKVDMTIRSHPQSSLAGAYGAALWGAFRARKLARRTA